MVVSLCGQTLSANNPVEESMKAAVDRVKANPDYITSGEVRLKTNCIQCGNNYVYK